MGLLAVPARNHGEDDLAYALRLSQLESAAAPAAAASSDAQISLDDRVSRLMEFGMSSEDAQRAAAQQARPAATATRAGAGGPAPRAATAPARKTPAEIASEIRSLMAAGLTKQEATHIANS